MRAANEGRWEGSKGSREEGAGGGGGEEEGIKRKTRQGE